MKEGINVHPFTPLSPSRTTAAPSMLWDGRPSAPPKDDISLNPSGPYKTQSPNLGHRWPALAKPCGVLPGGGTAADPGHLQVPCSGGQAFLLHRAGRSMGTGLFMHIASPSGQTLWLQLLPR